jgi:two-component system, chemotaxis family, protein-glutamate methylesterase/glutaminase
MEPIRVLVVDDALTIRRLVTNILDAEADIDVVGTAANGRIAMTKIEQLAPDVVTLDVEMPEMDGLATLRALREAKVVVPVIMFSTLTERGASTTLDALSLGAADYVTKPTNTGNLAGSMDQVREQLIPKVRALAAKRRDRSSPARTLGRALPSTIGVPTAPPAPTTTPGGPFRLRPAPAVSTKVDVVAIGVSTGGPNALTALMPGLPASFEVPIVIVQHMPPMFTALLADRLASRCALRVVEAAAAQPLEPGTVYLAPGGQHMTVERHGAKAWLALNDDPPENSCRPAVDVLFRSVAREFGAHTLGVVLTGMGRDGLLGSEVICAAGGRVIVQDEATSVVWGMPGVVAEAELAEAALPLDQIAGEIVRRTGHRPSRGLTQRVGATPTR